MIAGNMPMSISGVIIRRNMKPADMRSEAAPMEIICFVNLLISVSTSGESYPALIIGILILVAVSSAIRQRTENSGRIMDSEKSPSEEGLMAMNDEVYLARYPLEKISASMGKRKRKNLILEKR